MRGGAQSYGSPSPRRTYLARGLSVPVLVRWGFGVIAMSGVVDDSPIVPIRSMLRPSTYRAFAARAKELNVDVPTLISRLADHAIRPPEPRRAAQRVGGPVRLPRDAVDRRIVELNAQRANDSAIALDLGMHQTAVSRRRRLMGLESPGRWG